jgi:hypothetical protein
MSKQFRPCLLVICSVPAVVLHCWDISFFFTPFKFIQSVDWLYRRNYNKEDQVVLDCPTSYSRVNFVYVLCRHASLHECDLLDDLRNGTMSKTPAWIVDSWSYHRRPNLIRSEIVSREACTACVRGLKVQIWNKCQIGCLCTMYGLNL